MKFLHLSDLHFGKTLHNVSLIESGDQGQFANETIRIIGEEKPDAVLIAGDIYDRGVPSKEAVQLFSRFLTTIAVDMEIPVLIIAGNHDGGERLEFARDILKEQNVYIAGTVEKEMVHVSLPDENGEEIVFWLMPYVYPAAVRVALQKDDSEIATYTDAVRELLAAQDIDYSKRNVLLAHQMVCAGGEEPKHSDSESQVGGVGGIDAALFEGFDYVALGHIHGAQCVGSERIRYCGAPLCYHFSEAEQKKGLLFVTIGEKEADLTFETRQTELLHRVRPTMIGTLEEIEQAEKASVARNEYVRVELTDETLPPNVRDRLEALFTSKGCILLDVVLNRRTSGETRERISAAENLSPAEHFERFYEVQKLSHVSPADREVLLALSAQVSEHPDKTEEELIQELVDMVLRQEA